VYAASGDAANALAFQRRADAALEVQLALNLAIGSERQRLASAASIAERTDRTISLSLGVGAREPGATALAALVLLQRKGRVLDAMTDTMASFRQRAGAAESDLLAQLGTITRDLARLALNGRGSITAEQHRAAIAALEKQKERVESAISQHNAEFRARALPVTLEAIQAAIPAGAALVEYAVFRPFDPKAASNAEAYGPPRYAAYVIVGDGPPRGFDLGAAAAIDEAVDRLRPALRDPRRSDVEALARVVDAQVFAAVRRAAGTASRLLISPDGALNLIPFETLVDGKGRPALERYAITYLSTGRDLLRMAVARPRRNAPLIVADPAFGAPASTAGSAPYFAPLPGTAQEAGEIRGMFPDAAVLSRDHASKAGLAGVPAPEILHIASHGFFLQDAGIENPLLRSGLALAGANDPSRQGGGGILTALEAANLDLWGTRLVTLSACDTGLGAVRNREGVYGLRRAFVLAGAETLVMSLWPVSDYVTRQMMSDYYRGLTKGLGRGEALRNAQRALRAQSSRRHPFYWASFIQAGDWRPLKGS
jgi:CHAT domain-containing protein